MIEPTDEMREAFFAADRAHRRSELERLGFHRAHLPTMDAGAFRAGLAAVLAIVERDTALPSDVLMKASETARQIAERLRVKGEDKTLTDPRTWTAMSAGARMVSVRLIELADDAAGNGYTP